MQFGDVYEVEVIQKNNTNYCDYNYAVTRGWCVCVS